MALQHEAKVNIRLLYFGVLQSGEYFSCQVYPTDLIDSSRREPERGAGRHAALGIANIHVYLYFDFTYKIFTYIA